MPEVMHVATVFVCLRACTGSSCCADFSRNRWSCQGSAEAPQSFVCERTCESAVRVCDCVCPAGFLLYFSFINLLQTPWHWGYFTCYRTYTRWSDTDCCSVSDFLVVFGLYLFAPLTLSSLIPLERLFTAKLMFANTQSRHTQYPFVCVCVCPSRFVHM